MKFENLILNLISEWSVQIIYTQIIYLGNQVLLVVLCRYFSYFRRVINSHPFFFILIFEIEGRPFVYLFSMGTYGIFVTSFTVVYLSISGSGGGAVL